jgi:thiamine biosynthesis protein ThiS
LEIDILVNGERRRVPAQTLLISLIEDLQLNQDRVAVEYNLNLLKREKWGLTQLSNGDQIEIVHFVGGGQIY